MSPETLSSTPAQASAEIVRGTKDPAALSHKITKVGDQLVWVNVYAPGPEDHDERTWASRNPTLATSYPSFIYNGPDYNPDNDDLLKDDEIV